MQMLLRSGSTSQMLLRSPQQLMKVGVAGSSYNTGSTVYVHESAYDGGKLLQLSASCMLCRRNLSHMVPCQFAWPTHIAARPLLIVLEHVVHVRRWAA